MSEEQSTATRRRSERVVPITHIGVSIEDGHPFKLWNLSYGGFAIVSADPFTPGTEARFTFTEARSGVWLNVVARAAHSMVLANDGELEYLSGWEFLLTGEEEAVIKVLFAAASGYSSPMVAIASASDASGQPERLALTACTADRSGATDAADTLPTLVEQWDR